MAQKEKKTLVMTRIQQELKQIEDDEDGIAASIGGQLQIYPDPHSNPYKFNAVMAGPLNSPYRDGIFTIAVDVPADYPFKPPKMNFTTKIWHPNIDFETGKISLDALRNNWNPCWTLQSILLTVFSVLQDPVLERLSIHQANHEAADAYRVNRDAFLSVAECYTEMHAGTKTRVCRLVNMGFDGALAESSLQRHGWNEDAAVAELLALMDLGDGTVA